MEEEEHLLDHQIEMLQSELNDFVADKDAQDNLFVYAEDVKDASPDDNFIVIHAPPQTYLGTTTLLTPTWFMDPHPPRAHHRCDFACFSPLAYV